MKDHADFADFCRQGAEACFHRRVNYPVWSDERARLMDEARRFIRHHRAFTGRLDRRRTIPKDKLTATDIEPLGAGAGITITLLEAFSRGEITRKDIEDQTGEYLSFAALLAQLHQQHLPLPRIPSDPQSPGVQLIKRLVERAMRRTTDN